MKELDHFNVNPKKPWYKKGWAITLVIILALFLLMLSVIGYFIYDVIKNDYLNENSMPLAEEDLGALIAGSDSNYWIGTNKPLITIVEFADFSCPYCQESFSKIREISKKYNNDVKIIFRDYPVVSDGSSDLAMAGRCAGEQGLFWVMHDKLFLNQGISEISELFNLAAQIGVDQTRFEKCFNNKKYAKEIEKDFADGAKLEITGTPTWFINGERVEGNIPYNIFISIIEKIIADNSTK